MKRIASKMQLHKGFEAEYKKRHNEIWPELAQLLAETGVSDYYIFLDETTNSLFATLVVSDEEKLDDLPSHPVMQKWWAYMKDIMESNPDNSPVSIPLKEVFFLP
ncbi:L-rhamnose mutarotase [Flavobacterium sp. Sd200]|uniref:L-rhamnose mutarotase n=1 Tax=Flavobacterium sp. Sd200 TaxID=2692211 RepID=UPI00136D4350|nr:L-rhamnose mutarotase [Flavobacterium sp. Sd200]MXN90834.1 L-rhamnose mutarotase [Flavobacterium sp. Sd200]